MEEWRDIKGYEKFYQVSNLGRVRSLDRVVVKIRYKKQLPSSLKGYILKPNKDKDGYLYVVLVKDKQRKTLKIHRLVAQAFIPNSDNLPQVNHKNEDKTDNFVYVDLDGTINTEKSNLEWCDNQYNCNYGTHNQRSAEKRSKPVLQYSLEGEFVKEWVSASEVQRQTGFDRRNVSSCCRGKQKSSKGYIWKYKERAA